MNSYNYAQAKATAAAADAADTLAADAAIRAARSVIHEEKKSASLFQSEKYAPSNDDHGNNCDDLNNLDVSSTGSIPLSSPSIDGDKLWTCRHCRHVHSKFKFRCDNCTSYNMANPPPGTEHDDKSSEKDESLWICSKCEHKETRSISKCSNCKGWRDGKRPKKSEANEDRPTKVRISRVNKQNSPYSDSTSTSEEFEFSMHSDKDPIALKSSECVQKKSAPHLSVRSKKDLKPLFEINDKVYAPWWEDQECNTEPSWYAAVITNYTTIAHSKYGPTRRYDVVYDDDDDETTDIEESFIFSREDYILTTSGKMWVGVENVLDDKSDDEWAKIVGWYDAVIGKITFFACSRKSVPYRHFTFLFFNLC